MAIQATTVLKTSAGSTAGAAIEWTRVEAATGCYLDMNGVNGDRMILLVAMGTTATAAANQAIYIGSSSTADSASTKLLFSAGKRQKLMISTYTDTLFKIDSRDAGDSGIYSINVLGPFETAKYKDTDGYINIAPVAGATTTTLVAAIALV